VTSEENPRLGLRPEIDRSPTLRSKTQAVRTTALEWLLHYVAGKLDAGVTGRIYLDINRGAFTGAGFQPRSEYIAPDAMR
jgi:hypothetical protein